MAIKVAPILTSVPLLLALATPAPGAIKISVGEGEKKIQDLRIK